MNITTDKNDEGLNKTRSDGQNESYLVLSDGERAKGFVAPYRTTYVHVGIGGHEINPSDPSKHGRTGKGCGVATTMNRAISETYAHDPKFYGSTYCVGCKTHLPVEEFKWDDGDVVGSIPEPRSQCKYCGGNIKIIEYFKHLEKHIADKENYIDNDVAELEDMKQELQEALNRG